LNVEDGKLKERNKKMFGFLLGTLQQFKKDMSVKSEAHSRREQIEMKVEAKVVEEQDKLIEQHKQLLVEKKQKAEALKEAIRKKEEEKEQQLLTLQWKRHRQLLSNFIKTKTQPSIFYLPIRHNSVTAELLKASKSDFEESYQKKISELNSVIQTTNNGSTEEQQSAHTNDLKQDSTNEKNNTTKEDENKNSNQEETSHSSDDDDKANEDVKETTFRSQDSANEQMDDD